MSEYKYENEQVIGEVTGWDPLLGFYGIPLKGGISIPLDAKAALGATGGNAYPTKKSFQNVSGGMAVATGGLKFISAKELGEMTPENPDWIWEGFFTVGGITMAIGKIKAAGKTTFITHACGSILDGNPFLGYPTKKTGVMYLTEQTNESFREHLRRANLLDRDDFVLLPWHHTKGVSWPDVVDMAVEEAKKRGLGLLVVDTLSRYANLEGDSENNAGDAMKAMKPLKFAAGEGLGVAVIGHERKSGGNVGDAGRGSSAFGGEVDIIASIKRPEGSTRPTIREIHTLSRFDQTPEKLVVELTDKGYRALGSDAAVAEEEAREAILEVLPNTREKAITEKELLAKVKEDGVNRTTAQAAMNGMLADEVIFRCGKGVKGDPYRYWQTGGDLHESSEASNHDTCVDIAADPMVPTALDKEDGSLIEDDGLVTDESVQGMLDTLLTEEDMSEFRKGEERRLQILRAMRDYVDTGYSCDIEIVEGRKALAERLKSSYWITEPLEFLPTPEEIEEVYPTCMAQRRKYLDEVGSW